MLGIALLSIFATVVVGYLGAKTAAKIRSGTSNVFKKVELLNQRSLINSQLLL